MSLPELVEGCREQGSLVTSTGSVTGSMSLPELVEGCREQRLFGHFDRLSDRVKALPELVLVKKTLSCLAGKRYLFLLYSNSKKGRTTRSPMLLLLLYGVLPLRYAERKFTAVLFQLPPRVTRLVPELAPMGFTCCVLS